MPEVFRQRLGLSITPLDGAFLVTVPGGSTATINHTALFVLDACTEASTADALTALVQEAYGLASEPHDEVAACLEALTALELVERSSGELALRVPQPITRDLEVRVSPGTGRGVFARRAFEPDEVVERAPVVVVSATEAPTVMGTLLGRYAFRWGDGIALGLGWASLYNHRDTPNVRWRPLQDDLLIELVARQAIAPGEELTIDYTGERADLVLGFTPLP